MGEDVFEHTIVAHTQDLCPANMKQISAGLQADKDAGRIPRISLPCGIHRHQTVSGKTYELCRFDVSGCSR